MAWLDTHPPARKQFRDPRRQPASGVIVVHTAENVMDRVGPDMGAENVARFIRGRSDPGSYHDLVDSDSIVNLVRYECEAFHDATGTNPHSYGLSFACSATDWQRMTATTRTRFIERGAQAAAHYARWLKASRGIAIPPLRISRPQSDNRVPGFISHAARDPRRRTDPGPNFPWAEFLARFKQLTAPLPPTPPAIDLEDDMPFIIEHNGEGGTFATRLVAPPIAVKITSKERKDYAAAKVTILPTSNVTASAILKQIGLALD